MLEIKKPTLLQTLGIGTASGTIAWFIFILWSLSVSGDSLDQIILYLLETILEPGFYAVLFVCIIGAFIGRAKGKSFRAVWIGAILPFLIWGLLGIVGVMLFCCQ